MNSDAHKVLKKEEVSKPEWVVEVLPKKAGLKVDHFSEVHLISRSELENIMRGYLKGEYWWGIIEDTEGHRIYVPHPIDMSRYSWLPKHMYRRFLKATCEILGIMYKVQMLEAVTAVRLTPRALIMFPQKSVFEKAEKRTAEIKEEEDSMGREIDRLREFMKSLKEERK